MCAILQPIFRTLPVISVRVCMMQACMVFVMVAVRVSAEEGMDDFSRYQVILDKKSFGVPPVAPPPPQPAPPPPPGPGWVNDFRMTMLVRQDDGNFRVGIMNAKSNEAFTLSSRNPVPVGADRIQYVSVDYDKKQVTLSKSGDVQTLALDTNPVPARPPVAARPPAPTMSGRPGSPRVVSGGRRTDLPPPPAPQNPRLTGAELEKHLQDYQMQVLREGLPPLPVQLTPENDAALVNEGVLDPLEPAPGQ